MRRAAMDRRGGATSISRSPYIRESMGVSTGGRLWCPMVIQGILRSRPHPRESQYERVGEQDPLKCPGEPKQAERAGMLR